MWRDLVDAVGFGFYTERDHDVNGEYPEVPGFWCAQPFRRMFLKYCGNVTICCFDDKDETDRRQLAHREAARYLERPKIQRDPEPSSRWRLLQNADVP